VQAFSKAASGLAMVRMIQTVVPRDDTVACIQTVYFCSSKGSLVEFDGLSASAYRERWKAKDLLLRHAGILLQRYTES
jgi:hypothetical protein